MAEGGFDEYEMGEFNPLEYPEYDDMDEQELRLTASNLRDSLVDGNVDTADTTEKIRYIEDKLLPSTGETSFVDVGDGVTISTGGEGKVSVASALPQGLPTEDSYVTAVDKFIQDTQGVRVDWGSDEGIRLRRRLGPSSKGGVKYKSYIGGKEYVVLEWNKRNQTFSYREVGGDEVKKAVKDFRDYIEKLVYQAKERETLTEGKDMVDVKHEYTPRRGLTDQENREHAGVLDPAPTIDRQTRPLFLNQQLKYLNGEIAETRRQLSQEGRKDSFELHEREIDLEVVREETLKRRELEERVESLESLRDEYEDQAVKEETREAQEEDISGLERFKRWARENLVGLSAVAISVAGIITTVVIAGRKAIMKGAQATGKFAKALANLAKKLGPLLAPLLNMLATVISWGVKGLAWLAFIHSFIPVGGCGCCSIFLVSGIREKKKKVVI